MKRIIALLLCCLLLCGCKMDTKEMDQALSIRQKLLNANSCSFDAQITAEYADKQFTFLLRCESDSDGKITFMVLEPESIANISGHISQQGGDFTFDGTVLAFETLADDTLSPIVAPWLMLRCLRGGYISYCATSDTGIVLDIDDTYNGTNLRSEILLDGVGIPQFAEIYYDGRRIMTVHVSNFEML